MNLTPKTAVLGHSAFPGEREKGQSGGKPNLSLRDRGCFWSHRRPASAPRRSTPALLNRHWQLRSTTCRAGGAGSTRSSSTVTGCRFIASITASRFSPDAATTGPIDLKKIADDAWHINAGSAVIDGEVVVPSADGTTDFSVLQNELKGKSTKIVMVAFDLRYLDGYHLRNLPLFERKALLKKTIGGNDLPVSGSFELEGREMFKHACKTGLEGVVPLSLRAF